MENEIYIIEKNKEGKMKRVWVEQKVKAPEQLSILQKRVAEANTNFKPEPTESLHMTTAHFGIPEELYADFQKERPGLILEQFMKQFYLLLGSCDGVIKGTSEAEGEKLEIFGESPYFVAAVKIVKTPEIMQRRQLVSQALQQFVKDLGVSDINKFMLNSPNLQFDLDQVYNPHITLGFVGENTTLPQLDVSNLKITLNPSTIANVKLTN